MKRTVLTLFLPLIAFAAPGCGDGGSNSLTNGVAGTPAPSASAGTSSPTTDPNAAAAAAQATAAGSPEVTSRQHGCGKMSIASIGQLLQSRGLTGKGAVPQGSQTGVGIFNAGDTPPALGAANYEGRTGESPFASTSAISKMFDIYTMASYDAVAAGWSAPACPNVQLTNGGQITKDGLTCLMGKPATDEHVAIANDAIAKNPTDGAKIAIASILSAAHTCQ
jgi:hypothetical protein